MRCLTVGHRRQTQPGGPSLRWLPTSEAPTGLADGAIGCWQTAEVRPPVDMRGAMAPVYVVTAASGDTYRIARVYLDWRDGT